MTRAGAGLGAAGVILAALGTASPARAQGLRLRAPTGQLGASFDGTWSAIGGERGSRYNYRTQWLDFTMGGHVRDPRVFSFTASLRPTLVQGTGRPAWDSVAVSDATRLTSYDLTASLLSILPVSLSAWGHRGTGQQLELFGTGLRYDQSELGATLRWRNRALPMALQFERERRLDSLTQRDRSLLVRDEILTVLEATATSSKLQASARRHELTDFRNGRNQTGWYGDAAHRLGWGKGSSLASEVHTVNRSGFMPLARVSWDERLHLQHTRAVGTSWRYGQFSTDVGTARNTGRSAEGLVDVAVLRPLHVTVEGAGGWSRFPAGSRDQYRAVPGMTLSLPFRSAVVRARAAVGYEWIRQNATDGPVSAVNEVHVLDPGGRFQLEQPYADAASLVLTNPDETLLFQAGVDYRVLEAGAFAEVVILPQGRIAAGDTVLADYLYRLLPTGRSDGVVATYGGTLAWQGARLYASRDLRQPQDSGPYPLVLSHDYFTAGVGFSRELGGVAANLLGEYQRRQYNGTVVRIYQANANVTAGFLRVLSATLSGTASRQRGDVSLDNARGDVELTWSPGSGLRLHARWSTWWWEQDDFRSEFFVGGGADAEIRVAQLTGRVAFSRGWWENGLQNVQNMLAVSLVRRF